MMAITKENDADVKATKVRRSRNGCTECRRLHRRCDEARPECKACVKDSKKCSYNRGFAFVGGPVKHHRSTKRVASPLATSPKLPVQAKDPVADAVQEVQNYVDLQLTGYKMLDWLPWLSSRHRKLIVHFANVTCSTFFLFPKHHHNLCSTLIPLAVDSFSGFPLIAAILCVASTHLKSLEVDTDEKEAAYWEAMAAGHLGRQVIAKDRTSTSVFAAAALLLSHRDIFAGGERAGSWRVHLEGALAVLDRPTDPENLVYFHVRSVGRAMRQVALIFTASLKSTMKETERCSSQAHFSTCDYFDEYLGISRAIMHVLVDIQSAASDMTALMNIERFASKGDDGMGTLWVAMGKRIQGVVQESQTIKEDLQNALSQSVVTANNVTALTEQEELAQLNQAYYHITMSQIQLRLLGLETYHQLVHENLELAMTCLERVRLRDHSSPGMALLQPCFIVGCFALEDKLRQRVAALLSDMKRKHGRQNAERARQFLQEFWLRRDADEEGNSQARLDLRLSLGVAHRSNELEWTDLMAQKGWDLSLW